MPHNPVTPGDPPGTSAELLDCQLFRLTHHNEFAVTPKIECQNMAAALRFFADKIEAAGHQLYEYRLYEDAYRITLEALVLPE